MGTCISLENELNLHKEVTLNIQEMKEAIDKDEIKSIDYTVGDYDRDRMSVL